MAILSLLSAVGNAVLAAAVRPQTFCNPLDLAYRFQLDRSCREAADPVIVLFKGTYWLFASKSGGYWHSADLLHWTFIESKGLPIETYAPAVAAVNGQLYYTCSSGEGTFTTQDPFSGQWTNVTTSPQAPWDAATFLDDDGRLYVYWGCDAMEHLKVRELDPVSFKPITEPQECTQPDLNHRGWEIAGDNNCGRQIGNTNLQSVRPWIEGSWMNKFKGRYYLQYSAPGTEFKTYGDGVFIGDKPTGPFTYAPYSPFSFKPTGFIAGAGHSCTFEDANAQLWHIATMTLSQRHPFERRLGLFPVSVLPDGQLTANTYLGDYPQYAPMLSKRLREKGPRWMLVSYARPARASSTLAPTRERNFEVANAFDENIRTWWSAQTANPGEWLQVDLEKNCRIDSMQINFADQGSTNKGRLQNDGYRYFVEVSKDAQQWNTVIDRREEGRDAPHDYVQLEKPVTARYVRITNVHTPAGGLFSLYGLRVFGSGLGSAPPKIKEFSAARDENDRRCARLSWKPTANTQFYIVRYGIAPKRLFGNYQVYNGTTLDIHSLNTEAKYYYTIDTVNDSGVTKGKKVLSTP